MTIFRVGVDPGYTRTGIALVAIGEGVNDWQVMAVRGFDGGEGMIAGRCLNAMAHFEKLLPPGADFDAVHLEVPSFVSRNAQSTIQQVYLAGYLSATLAPFAKIVKLNPATVNMQMGLKGVAKRTEKKLTALKIARAHGLPESAKDDEAEAACMAAMEAME